MRINTTIAAIAATTLIAVPLALPAVASATTAQARQITTLKAELKAADHAINLRNATIKADVKTIAARNATIAAGWGSLDSTVSAMTPAQAWTLVPLIYTVLNASPAWTVCTNETVYSAATTTDGTTNGDGSGYSSRYYDLSATTWFGWTC
jgi:hypothetical protein